MECQNFNCSNEAEYTVTTHNVIRMLLEVNLCRECYLLSFKASLERGTINEKSLLKLNKMFPSE